MAGQVGGQVVSVDLDADEVHGERELVVVQQAVLVDVRQLPDLAEHGVRQLRLHHLRLSGCGQTDRELLQLILSTTAMHCFTTAGTVGLPTYLPARYY